MPFRLRKGFVGTRYFQIAEEACALAQSIYGLLLNGQYMKVCLKFLIHLHVYQKSHQHFTFSHQGSQTPTAHSFPDISSPLFSIPYIKFCYLPQHDSVKLIVSFMNVFRCQKNRTPKERVLDHLSIYLFICLFFLLLLLLWPNKSRVGCGGFTVTPFLYQGPRMLLSLFIHHSQPVAFWPLHHVFKLSTGSTS